MRRRDKSAAPRDASKFHHLPPLCTYRHTHTCPGGQPQTSACGRACRESPARPPAGLLRNLPPLARGSSQAIANYFTDSKHQVIDFLSLLWLPGSSKPS